MNWFKNLSVRYKIVSIIVMVSLFSSLIPLTLFLLINIQFQRDEMIKNLLTNARITSEYCARSLVLKDKETAQEMIDKLKSLDYIESLAVYDLSNQFFAGYNQPKEGIIPYLKAKETFQTDSFIIVCRPILHNYSNVGNILFKVKSNELVINVNKVIWIVILTFLGILILTLLIAGQFQQIISKPLIRLANVARKASDNNDFSVRLKTNFKDEIGYLYDAFNYMMGQIESREQENKIQNLALETAKIKAEQADNLKTAFLANMSHEIRTPMNSIIGFASLLNMNETTEEERKLYVNLIQSSGNTLLHLLDDIIDISRIEADQVSIQKTHFNLYEFMEEIYLKYSRELTLTESNPDVSFIFSNFQNYSDQEIYTDIFRLRQILINLINNAIKFTEKGKIIFGYQVETEKILFFVKDTGIGLPNDKLELVFKRFLKIEGTDRHYRGAGLGLAISKRLVELLGGSIWVESTQNVGSEFYFTLPANITIQTNIKESVQNNIKIQKTAPEGKTLLVAEDEKTNFLLIQQILKKLKFKIIWAENGELAIELFKTNPVDIVLMDIKMSKIDGLEATRQIKQINPKIPVIAQTAYAMAYDKEEILKSGFDGYISKPINPNELRQLILKYL